VYTSPFLTKFRASRPDFSPRAPPKTLRQEALEAGVSVTTWPGRARRPSKKGGRGWGPAIRFFLDATPTQKPLSMTDLVVIQQGLHQFIDAVKDETAQMMAPQRKKPKKKA
jgi:hypothetical protein